MSLDQISFLPPEQQQEILNGPALLPPNGTIPNFDNSPNNNGLGIAALTVCLVASSLAMLVRAQARIFVDKTSRIEDYIGLSAFGTYVGYIYLNYRLLAVCGFFVHQWDVRVKEMSQILHLITVGSTLYSVTVGLLKVGILREFCGIFVPLGGRNTFWWACHVLMGLNIAYYFATGIFVTNFSCSPREKIWDKTIPGGHCINNKVTYLAASVVNVISDFIILALPQKIIWNLKMPTRSKVGASAVFAIGLLACVSAVVRLAVTVSWYSADDELYALSSMTLWAIAEMTCMFLVFCSHAAPRVFCKKGHTSRMAATAKSWLSLPSSRLKYSTGSSQLHDVPGITKDDHAEYSRIEESRGGLNTTASVGPLQEDIDRPKVAILYTKHFTATEGQARDSIEMDQLNRQHPWTNYKHN